MNGGGADQPGSAAAGDGVEGWNACDLARLAGLSPATLTAALKGTPLLQDN